jgi:hypothetical protein
MAEMEHLAEWEFAGEIEVFREFVPIAPLSTTNPK